MLFNEFTVESAVTGGILEKAVFDREKKQLYSEHVRFEKSVRHPSRGHQAENCYMVLEAGAQERATDTSSVIVGI